ncbi:MAG: alanine racemase [Muribaculaceae bacterium]|nr:alanine racemase [Muribaculaceae bacterium]
MRKIKVCDLAHYNISPAEIRFSTSDPEGHHEIAVLATDSRSIGVDADITAFAALRTTIGDGRRFIPALAEQGVKVFIVDELTDELRAIDATFIVVESVPEALTAIGRSHIANAANGVVITGSHGKTTVKELIYRSLLPVTKVRRSPRSWNSHLGLPLAMWDMGRADDAPEVIITEAAIDGPGQADNILRAISGTCHIAVLTPIDDEHDEAFPSHADKVAEKIHIASTCDTIIYTLGDDDVQQAVAALKTQRPELRVVPVAPLADLPSTLRALAATAVAEILGTDVVANSSDADAKALDPTTLPLPETRRRITSGIFGNTIVRDAFTPDLRSLADSLNFFKRHTGSHRRKVLITDRLLDADFSRVEETAFKAGIDEVFDASSADTASIRPLIEAGNKWRGADILIFGDADGDVAPYVNALEGASHDTVLEVDLDAIVANYNYFRTLVPAGTGIVAMVKASAYGMGARRIGRTLQDHGAAALAVAVIEEGVDLREAGVDMPIIVLNPITNHHHTLFTHHLEPTVFSADELSTLLHQAEADNVTDYPVHIKLDTGMHRVGFLEDSLASLAATLRGQRHLRVASVFTHLATADCLDMDAYTLAQIETFKRMADKIENLLGYPVRRHFLNTAGMMRFADKVPYDMARLGIGLYGIAPYEGSDAPLRLVATFRTHIISIKHWPEGTPIGYGCRGITTRPSVIATIPVGYADGINRHLGRGHASFYIDGIPCPTIGNICMDQCMIDVTDVPGVDVGAEVVIFSPEHPVQRLSDTLDTIPYEVLTSVSPRVRRSYIKR